MLLPCRAVPVTKGRPEGGNVALPLVLRDDPRVAKGVPELALLGGEAVDEEVNGLDGQQRGDDLRWKVWAVVGVVRGVDDLVVKKIL